METEMFAFIPGHSYGYMVSNLTSVEAREGAGGKGRAMTEHIFETLETDAGLGVVVDGTMAITGVTAQREEVVRCRDCVHWRKPSKHERSKCTGAMAFVEPTPEGFCAWGKREEES